MDFDAIEYEFEGLRACEEEFDDDFTFEQLKWHENIFNFLNTNNILYIPDQHYLV